MALFIISIILFVVAAVSVTGGFISKLVWPFLVGAGTLLLGLFLLFLSTFWTNGVGEAKVVVNSIDRTVIGVIETPGSGFREPWADTIDFDLFSQELKYAGDADSSPSYAGGTVSGREITVSVGGVGGGSTKADIDATFTYSVDADAVRGLYEEFKSQERFTEQIIAKQVLSITRQIPANYTAIEFRGTKRGEAEQAILDMLNEKLDKFGVEFSTVTIQDVRYPEGVENALTSIEEANQNAQKAEADKRTAEVNAETALVKAQGEANAQIEKARGEAEANRLLVQSLTPEIVELRRIEALAIAAESGQLIIDGGNGNLLLQPVK